MYCKGRISFSFIAEEWSRVCTHCSFFIHSLIIGYGSCFHGFNNVHNTSMNMGCIYIFKLPFSSSLKAPKWKCLRLYFEEPAQCPHNGRTIHVPTSSAQGFPLPHILTNTACFLFFDRPSLTFAGHQPLWRCAAQPCGSWPSPAPACPAMFPQQVRSEGESSSPLVHQDPGQGQSRVLWSLTLTQVFRSLLRQNNGVTEYNTTWPPNTKCDPHVSGVPLKCFQGLRTKSKYLDKEPAISLIRKFQQFMNLWARNCGWRSNIYFLKVSISQAHHIWVSFEMRNLCNQSQNIKCWKPKDKTVIAD